MFYKLKFLGLERTLPILKAPSGIYIAGFNPVGDMELLIKSAKKLTRKVKEQDIQFDLILTTELKGLPIAQEVAHNLKCDYICLRKDKKCYMLNPKQTNGNSITSGKSTYYISELELNKLKNKKVLFVDDVYSTGSTFKNMLEFAKQENFEIVAGLSILREGDNKNLIFSYDNIPIFCCGFLPLPKVENNNKNNANKEEYEF